MLRASVDVEVATLIARPRADVWPFVTDPKRYADWLGDFESADGEAGPVGAVVRFALTSGHRGSFQIVEWDPPRRVAWDGPPMPGPRGGATRARGSHELSAEGDGQTRLVSHYRPELLGTAVLVGPYVKRWVRRQRTADAARLKGLLEGGGN